MKVLETKSVEVPDYPGSKVVMYTKAPWGAYKDIKQGMNEVEMAIHILPYSIIEWNFDDQDGNPLPVSPDSVAKLPQDLSIHLLKEAVAKQGTLKKKTSVESTVSSEEKKSE